MQAEDEDVQGRPPPYPSTAKANRAGGGGGVAAADPAVVMDATAANPVSAHPIHEGSSEHPTEHASEHVAEGDDEPFAGDEVTDQHGEPAQAERTGAATVRTRNAMANSGDGGAAAAAAAGAIATIAITTVTAAPGMNESGAPAPQHSFGPDDETRSAGRCRARAAEAVADLDAAPPSAPSAPVSAEPRPAERQPEPPRRRSTVRERAPIGGGDEAPPPAPTAPGTRPCPGAGRRRSRRDRGHRSAAQDRMVVAPFRRRLMQHAMLGGRHEKRLGRP